MPRDASGNMTLVAGNPVQSNTVISSTWANPTMSDLANELTQSLDRSGRGGMLVPFLNVDGTAGAPGITFTNEPVSGIYLFGTNDVRVSINAGDVVMFIDATAQTVGEQKPFLIWNGLAWEAPVTQSNINLSSPPPIGDVTPDTGAFTTLSASGIVTFTSGTIDGIPVGASTPDTGAFTTLSASGLVTFTSGTIDGIPVGATTPDTGSFTTLNLPTGATVDDISNDGTLASGSATALVTENAVKTYVLANINAFDASSPPPIGDVAPDTGRFTTLQLTSGATVNKVLESFAGSDTAALATQASIKAYIATQPVGFDPSSPSPIGDVTPNTIASTELTTTDLAGVGVRGVGVDATGKLVEVAAVTIPNSVLASTRLYSYFNL